MKLWMNKLADEAIDKLSEEEMMHLFANELQRCYNVTGGREAWLELEEAEQAKILADAHETSRSSLGSATFDRLCPEDQKYICLCIWSGCAAHKIMNLFKSGCKKMDEMWGLSRLTPPILLPNKDNDTVLAMTENDPGYGDAAWHAI